ncbi:MAG: hypothetical protein IT427_03085, partial [Pirellulales bacterium]|nr:hypothetical protein [Pirellulales bacterium]
NLSNVATITGPNNSQLTLVTETGGSINLNGLQTITNAQTDADANVRFAFQNSFTLPNLTTATKTQFDAAASKTITLSALTSLTRSQVNLNGGAISAPALIDVSNSRIAVSAGSTYTLPAAVTSYSATGINAHTDIFSADGAGSALNLSSLQNINDGIGPGYYHTIRASNTGTIDLSNVATITGPNNSRLTLTADTGGQILLNNMHYFHLGATRLQIGAGSTLATGKLAFGTTNQFYITSPSSNVTIDGYLYLYDAGELSMASASSIHIHGNFGWGYTDESKLGTSTGIVYLDGGGTQRLEAAGTDLGLLGSSSGNFGLGRLVVGTASDDTTVQLVDWANNGNRVGNQSEALYLYGVNGMDGLELLGGSRFELGNLNVYAFQGGQWIHLNSLFPNGVFEIPYQGGTLVKPGMVPVPGDFDNDGDVDGADFVAWQTNFPAVSGKTITEGDADWDGDVDGADFVIWQTNFPYVPGPSAAPVPEPAAGWLCLLIALQVGIANHRSARRRRHAN